MRVSFGIAILLAVSLLTSPPALAKKWDLFISGQDRQLRSISLMANGFSTKESAPGDLQLKDALEQAKLEALRTAAEELEDEILAKNPALTFSFLGQDGPPITPGVQATLPNLADTKLLQAVFVMDWEEIPETTDRPLGVNILAEVAYIIYLPTDDGLPEGPDDGGLDEIEGAIDDEIESAPAPEAETESDQPEPSPTMPETMLMPTIPGPEAPVVPEPEAVASPDPLAGFEDSVAQPHVEPVEPVVIPAPEREAGQEQAADSQSQPHLALTPSDHANDPEGYDPLADIDSAAVQQELHQLLQEKLDSLLQEEQ